MTLLYTWSTISSIFSLILHFSVVCNFPYGTSGMRNKYIKILLFHNEKNRNGCTSSVVLSLNALFTKCNIWVFLVRNNRLMQNFVKKNLFAFDIITLRKMVRIIFIINNEDLI